MIYFVNKLKFNYNKYQYNGTIIEESYKAKFLFPIHYLLSFLTDNKLIIFVLNRFLSENSYESVCHNFNLLKFETKILLHVNNGLSCVLMFAICVGGTDSWDYKFGDIV